MAILGHYHLATTPLIKGLYNFKKLYYYITKDRPKVVFHL